MGRKLAWLLWLLAVAVTANSARTEAVEQDALPSLATDNALIKSSLERIAAGSRLWREALQRLQGSGRRAVIVTPDQIAIRERADQGALEAFDPDVLAEVAQVAVEGSRVREVVVVVNLPLLNRLYHSQPSSSYLDLTRDLDRIVIHEVYGHALPYLIAGSLAGRCSDPEPGQRATDACAIRRENAVRTELGLGVRRDAGVDGLALVRRGAIWPTLGGQR
jgi:hypothetical protein